MENRNQTTKIKVGDNTIEIITEQVEKNIPERFHILFQTDWNKGNDSEMTTLHRAELNVLYLEYNRWDIQQRLNKHKVIEPEVIVGFTKD